MLSENDSHKDSFLRHRQRQRPPRPPPSDASGHGRRRTRTSSTSPRPRQRRNHLFLLLLWLLAGLAIWYWTPISDLLTSVLLQQVPLEGDLALGRQARQSFPYPTIRHSTWSPLVKQVGQELVTTLSNVEDPRRILRHEEDDTRGEDSYWEMFLNLLETLFGGADSNHQDLANRYQWDFGVVQAPLVNAFALPGGTICVTDQLLEQLSPTRAELAALLGHEMGHVLHRHSQARLLQAEFFHNVLAALTYQDHDDQDETFGEALGELLLQSANWFGQQRFSRANEYQADATGWNLLVESKTYNPQAVKSLLQKLWALEGRSKTSTSNFGGASLAWTSSHPATQDRIEALKHRWQQLSKRQQRQFQTRAS